MERVVDHLLKKMMNRGVDPQEIPLLVRDTLTIFFEGGGSSVERINQKLESMEWRGQVVDEGTLVLIPALLEGMREPPDTGLVHAGRRSPDALCKKDPHVPRVWNSIGL